MNDKNLFGGGNPHGTYVPLSGDEQEVLSRLAEEDLVLLVHGWGVRLEKPRFTFGDLRVAVGPFNLLFHAPAAPTKVESFDLELQRSNGQTICRETLPLPPGGVEVCTGVELTLQWDIAIDHMDPAFVREVKPGAFGLTSLRQDRDTKERTVQGNMRLNPLQKKVLHALEEGNALVRMTDRRSVKR